MAAMYATEAGLSELNFLFFDLHAMRGGRRGR